MYLGNTKMIVVKVSCTPFVYCCTCINFVSTDNTDFLKSLVELRLENVKKKPSLLLLIFNQITLIILIN